MEGGRKRGKLVFAVFNRWNDTLFYDFQLQKEFLDSQLKQAVTFSEAIKHFDDDFVGEDIDEIPSDEEKREKEERADLKAYVIN